LGVRNVSLDDDIEQKIEDESKKLGISVSAFIRLLAAQYFNGLTFERKLPVEVK